MSGAAQRALQRLGGAKGAASIAERLLSAGLAGPSAQPLALELAALRRAATRHASTAAAAPRAAAAAAPAGLGAAAAAALLARGARCGGAAEWTRAARRLYSSGPGGGGGGGGGGPQLPRRRWERFFPKNMPRRPARPAAKDAPKPPPGEGNGGGRQSFEEVARSAAGQALPLLGVLLLGASLLGGGREPQQEVSFQWFKANLLARGAVERLEVANKQTVRVFVKPGFAGAGGSAGGLAAGGGGGAAAAGGAPADGGDAYEPAPPAAPRAARGGGGAPRYFFNIGSVDAFEHAMDDAQEALGWGAAARVPVVYTSEVSWAAEAWRLAPTALLIAGYVWFTRRQLGGLGGPGGGPGGRGIFNVGKATVTLVDKNAKGKVSFADVAGCDEAKAEVMEFVNFLKKPGKYRELGAKIPRGALLVGPPGTGKTLLAKATASEAGVPFLSISGSDFMEMFVGVGPARVRDLFAQARAQAPAIIFIDEVDAIGRARGRGGFAGGNDERENTLNQLLVEMDGFPTTASVVVLAGTNRPDILDPALLRPGRFDRQIALDRPDVAGREQIFRVHLARLRLDADVAFYSERLAALTPGFAGADIANVCNEAALVAARADKAAVGMPDFEAAVDRVIGGLEKRHKVISPEERRTVAYHEAGHAVAGWFLRHAEPLLKVSIVPRGSAALGFAQYLPNENLLQTTEQMADMMAMALGGRAAEQLLLGAVSTGAQNDLERITRMAYAQVAVYGMSPKVGLLSFPPSDGTRLDKPYSEDTAREIDVEVRQLVDAAYARTLALLEAKRPLVVALAEALLEKEVLGGPELEAILGARPFKPASVRNIDRLRDGFAGAAAAQRAAGGEDEEGAGAAPPPPPPTDTPAGDMKPALAATAAGGAARGPRGKGRPVVAT